MPSSHHLPLVLLHAFPLDSGMWAPQRSGLSERIDVITLDFPGFGAAPGLDEESFTMARAAHAVESALDARGIERCILGGLSMGGYVAFECWRLFRSRIAGLILADTKAAADDEKTRTGRYEAIERIGRGEIEGFTEDLLKKLLSERTCRDHNDVVNAVRAIMRSASPASLIAAQLGMASRRDSSDLLLEIDVPTALIFGEEDAITTVEEGRRMAAMIPDVHLTMIPGAAHLTNIEMPREFNRAALKLVERTMKELDHSM